MTKRERKLQLKVDEQATIIQELNKKIKLLDERLRIELLKKYGQKREKLPEDNNFLPGLELEEVVEVEEAPVEEVVQESTVPKKKRKKSRNFADFTKNLETKVTEIKLSDEEVAQRGLLEIGYDSYKRIAVIPSTYYVEETRVMKYARRDCPSAGVITPYYPKGAISGSYFDASFYAQVLVRKYADHLPLYRQVEMMKRLGLKTSRQTLSQMVLKLSETLNPIVELLQKKILDSRNVFLDETEVKLQATEKCKKSYFWQMSGSDPSFPEQISDPPLVCFKFFDNRRHENVDNLLGENYQGNFHSDVYNAYEQYAKKDGVNWQPCWAHARRNFFEATTQLEFRTKIIRLMDKLFEKEREYWELFKEELSDKKRIAFRASNCKPLVDEIFSEIDAFIKKGHYLLKEKIFTACSYLANRKAHFETFLNQPNMRIDNNVSERKIRPITIGRKNWIFVGSIRGGEAAANIYSLIQTCRNLKINPQEYLEDVFRRINNITDLELPTLLPQNWTKQD